MSEKIGPITPYEIDEYDYAWDGACSDGWGECNVPAERLPLNSGDVLAENNNLYASENATAKQLAHTGNAIADALDGNDAEDYSWSELHNADSTYKTARQKSNNFAVQREKLAIVQEAAEQEHEERGFSVD